MLLRLLLGLFFGDAPPWWLWAGMGVAGTVAAIALAVDGRWAFASLNGAAAAVFAGLAARRRFSHDERAIRRRSIDRDERVSRRRAARRP